jgi:ribosomal protein L32
MTIDQRFNNTKSNNRNFFSLMAAATLPASIDKTDNHTQKPLVTGTPRSHDRLTTKNFLSSKNSHGQQHIPGHCSCGHYAHMGGATTRKTLN